MGRDYLAQCLINCDEHEEAEEILRELLEIKTQTLGANHEGTLMNYGRLGTWFGKYGEV